jgi:uncharacterized protein (TIGR03067 family)
MRGTWVVVRHEVTDLAVFPNGRGVIRRIVHAHYVLKGDERVVVASDRMTYNKTDRVFDQWHLRRDDTRGPEAIDLVETVGGKVNLGICRLAGDTLTICYAKPGMDRPKDFIRRLGHTLLVLRRGR